MRLSVIALLLLPLMGWSQKLDRSKAPAPGPAPEVRLGESKSFQLKNGLQVIVVENDRLPRVSWQLSIKRDPIFEGLSAGYVSIAGDLLSAGTEKYSKSELDQKVDFIGAQLSTYSTGIFAQSLSKHKEVLLELMAEVLLHPTMPEEELEKIKTRTISAITSGKDDPNNIASNVGSRVAYGEDHPYGEIESAETVQSVTQQQCQEYFQRYFKPNQAYLIVVGDIKAKQAKKLVKKYLGGWQSGEVPSQSYPQPEAPASTGVAFSHKPNAVQSVIRITYPVDLKPGSPDAIKANVMNAILGYQGGFSGRLMQNIREDKAYTYGAYSSLSSDEVCGLFSASASVRNEVTDSAVYEFLYEMRRLREEPVQQEELQRTLKKLAGVFALSLENPQTVARFAYNKARYGLPDDYYQNYLKRLMSVTVEDVQAMAKKYLKPDNAHIVVVGDALQVADKLSRFGEVSFYDAEGLATEAPRASIPEGLKAEDVIKRYLEAIGGAESAKEVKSLYSVSAANTQQGEMRITTAKESPNKSFMRVTFKGMIMNEMRFNGTDGSASGATGPTELTQEQIKAMRSQQYIIEELDYLEGDFELKLAGAEQVDGQTAYAVLVTDQTGKQITKYYGAKDGLLLKIVDPQSGAILVSDYHKYKEVLMPRNMTLEAMGITFVVEKMEVNESIDKSLFKLSN